MGADCSPMKFDEFLDDSQAEAKATVFAARRRIDLCKTIKNLWKVFLRDSCAVIGDDNVHVGMVTLQRQMYAAAFRRELDGIGNQVPDDLLKPFRIAGNRTGQR